MNQYVLDIGYYYIHRFIACFKALMKMIFFYNQRLLLDRKYNAIEFKTNTNIGILFLNECHICFQIATCYFYNHISSGASISLIKQLKIYVAKKENKTLYDAHNALDVNLV